MFVDINKELYSYEELIDTYCAPINQWRNSTFEEREAFVLSGYKNNIFPMPKEYPCIIKSYEESDPHGHGPFDTETHFYFIYLQDLEEELKYHRDEIDELTAIIERMKNVRTK